MSSRKLFEGVYWLPPEALDPAYQPIGALGLNWHHRLERAVLSTGRPPKFKGYAVTETTCEFDERATANSTRPLARCQARRDASPARLAPVLPSLLPDFILQIASPAPRSIGLRRDDGEPRRVRDALLHLLDHPDDLLLSRYSSPSLHCMSQVDRLHGTSSSMASAQRQGRSGGARTERARRGEESEEASPRRGRGGLEGESSWAGTG